MAGVLIFGEVGESGVTRATLQVATAGMQLAAALGELLIGALIGPNVSAATEAFPGGLAALYRVEGDGYRPYSAHAYVEAACAILEQSGASLVLCPHGADTREWVPMLAARLDTGLVMDCTALRIENGALAVTKPVSGGAVSAEFIVHGKPAMATVRASAYDICAVPSRPQVIRIDVPVREHSAVTVLGEEALGASEGPRLKDARIVVSGGRGVGGRDQWHLIEEASQALGAAIGCSRPVADSGWVPSSYQVGLSGTCVAPDLYIAVGISGAAQHLAGITAAKTVVAINNNAEAEIFSRADYGVVEDYREVLPAFVERVKQLRARDTQDN